MKPTGSCQVEIIATGDELMYGRILDTNSNWIAKRVAELGGTLRRVTMIGDDSNLISTVLQEALKRDTHFIFITGGLGPSEDDLTVESIGKSLGRKSIIDEQGAEKIREVYRRRGITDKKGLMRGEKMARILEGSYPLQNPVGFSVGMMLLFEEKIIVTFPGVPAEMKAMFDTHIAKLVEKKATSRLHARTYYVTMIWKDFFPLYRELQKEYPEIYIKNAATPPVHDQDREKEHTIKVDIVVKAPTQEEAGKKMDSFIKIYKERIKQAGGGKITPFIP